MDVVADKERRGRIAWHQAHMHPALVDVEEDIVAEALPLMDVPEKGHAPLDVVRHSVHGSWQGQGCR